MKLIATPLNDVFVVESRLYRDDRGFFNEVYTSEKFGALGLPSTFAQDNHSRSKRDVLRGLHFQRNKSQGKLVRPLNGAIFDVAVDLRKSSSTFGKWHGMTLEAGDGKQLWIPPGFAHGFVVLTDTADVFYKCTEYYNQQSEESLLWNDLDIGIRWPKPNGGRFLLSDKDNNATPFSRLIPFP